METFVLILNLIGALGVFLYGLKVMSEGLQKAAGPRLREILAKATDNRFMGTLSGFIITAVVQSSSATTVMVVGFCSAGLMTLYQSLGVIFGANIGTTTTAWLVSFLGFKVKISQFAVTLAHTSPSRRSACRLRAVVSRLVAPPGHLSGCQRRAGDDRIHLQV